MNEIARTMPGYISHKGFFADDGERVTIVEFEHAGGAARVADAPRTRRGAEGWAATSTTPDYSIQICEVRHESRFNAR